MTNIAKNFNDKIKAAKDIVIIMHNNPDGDALGSALCLAQLIELNFGVTPICIYDGKLPNFIDWLPKKDNYVKHVSEISSDMKTDLAIVVDCGDLDLVKETAKQIFNNSKDSIKIDHHPDLKDFAELNIVKLTAAAAQIILNLALDLNWKINTDIATCIYTAILTDTGNFRHIKTPDAFIDTAKCVEFGANPELISQIMGKKNKQDVLINAEIILNTQFFFNDKLAISVIDKQTYPRLDGKGSNTMAELLSIDTIEYIALIKEVKTDEIYVSLRSKTDPVNIIAKELGGGGHPNAGAFKSQTSIENTTKLLIAEFTAILS